MRRDRWRRHVVSWSLLVFSDVAAAIRYESSKSSVDSEHPLVVFQLNALQDSLAMNTQTRNMVVDEEAINALLPEGKNWNKLHAALSDAQGAGSGIGMFHRTKINSYTSKICQVVRYSFDPSMYLGLSECEMHKGDLLPYRPWCPPRESYLNCVRTGTVPCVYGGDQGGPAVVVWELDEDESLFPRESGIRVPTLLWMRDDGEGELENHVAFEGCKGKLVKTLWGRLKEEVDRDIAKKVYHEILRVDLRLSWSYRAPYFLTLLTNDHEASGCSDDNSTSRFCRNMQERYYPGDMNRRPALVLLEEFEDPMVQMRVVPSRIYPGLKLDFQEAMGERGYSCLRFKDEVLVCWNLDDFVRPNFVQYDVGYAVSDRKGMPTIKCITGDSGAQACNVCFSELITKLKRGETLESHDTASLEDMSKYAAHEGAMLRLKHKPSGSWINTVALHLQTPSTDSTGEMRAHELHQLRGQLAMFASKDEYIIMGGDFNINLSPQPAVSELEASKGRQLTVVRVRTCPTARLGGELPIPLIGTISGALPEPDAIRPRFQAMERQMRSVPGWQPLEEPQAVLPTALEMPQDAALAARRIDALIVGVLTVGLAVLAASVPVALVSLLAPTGPPSRGLEEKTRLLEAGAGEVAQEQKDEEEFEMQLGPLKTVVFAVYYVCNILFLLVLTSWSKADNLMLGGAGLAWEIIWLWLVVVLATDVVGYLFRAVQAAWMKRQISVTDPAISIVMSVFPVLGPRVDLLKDCLFAGAVFQLAACQAGSWRRTAGFCLGNAALLTIFLPAPALFRFETTRRDLAAEFWPALVARLRVKKAGQRERPRGEEEQTTWEWLLQKAEGFVVPKLVAQCTQSRLWTALGEDLPQAILAIVAMVVFEQYSGVLLVNLVISGGKIAAVFSLREFIWRASAKREAARRSSTSPRGAWRTTWPRWSALAPIRQRTSPVLARRSDVGICSFSLGPFSRLHRFPAKRGVRPRRLDVLEASAQSRGGTPLHLAAYQGHAACVDLLLKAGADKNLLNSRGSDVRTSVGMTPLHVAADNGHAACVELLLKAGAEKDVQGNVYGGTPLHLAAREGHAACVELLLKAGAEKDVQNNVHGGTPLLWAAGKGHAACVEVLLMAGAEKDVQNVHGEPPLYQAAFGGHAECVDLLLKAGAQKDVQNEYGMTPLHGAALPGHPDCVDLLLKAGADKDVQHSAGGTPLHVAAERGHAACVEVLLKAGAKKGLKDRDGDTALDLAREKGRRDYSEGRRACISLLEEAGARGSRDGFLSWMLK